MTNSEEGYRTDALAQPSARSSRRRIFRAIGQPILIAGQVGVATAGSR